MIGIISLITCKLFSQHFQNSVNCSMIQTPTTPGGIIKDNSILRMLENSLSEGVLYSYRDDERNDTQPMFELLCSYWGAVRDVFRDAWGKPPKKSRLMHGAGILSMGYVMDAI